MPPPNVPPTSSIPPATIPSAPPTAAPGGGQPAAPPAPRQGDHAVISKDGRDALAKEAAARPTQGAPAHGLTDAQAAALGQGLKHSNPAHFKKYDTNGDGKLSVDEARAAGLG